MSDGSAGQTETVDAIGRLTRAIERFEIVGERIVGMLEVHNEKLDAILDAATQEAGPSLVAMALEQIVAALRDQEQLLLAIPAALAQTVREEMQRELVEEHEAEGEDAYEPDEHRQ